MHLHTMRNGRTVLLFAALTTVLLASCSPRTQRAPSRTPAAPQTTPAPRTIRVSAELANIYRLVNETRARGYDCGREGVFGTAPALALRVPLMSAAQRHSEDMRGRGGEGSHTGSDGTRAMDRVVREGYAWSWVGENVAWSFGFDMTPEQVMDGWLKSPGHCRNIMNPNFAELGLGKAGTYWTQVFAAPQ